MHIQSEQQESVHRLLSVHKCTNELKFFHVQFFAITSTSRDNSPRDLCAALYRRRVAQRLAEKRSILFVIMYSQAKLISVILTRGELPIDKREVVVSRASECIKLTE